MLQVGQQHRYYYLLSKMPSLKKCVRVKWMNMDVFMNVYLNSHVNLNRMIFVKYHLQTFVVRNDTRHVRASLHTKILSINNDEQWNKYYYTL